MLRCNIMGTFNYICKGCGEVIRGDCFLGGDDCVMIHVRHGDELGRVEGHYDEYGKTIEEKDFSEDKKFFGESDSINSHSSIYKSLRGLDDSFLNIIEKRLYNGKFVSFSEFVFEYAKKSLKENEFNIERVPFFDDLLFSAMHSDSVEESLNQIDKYYKGYKNVNNEKDKKIYSLDILSELECVLNLLILEYKEDKSSFFYNMFLKLEKVNLSKYSGVVAYHKICYNKAIKNKTFNLVPSFID